MKRLLLILILILSFQSWTKADDISEFEIEGMSVGDSLLDYFSEEEIKVQFPYNKKTFGGVVLHNKSYEIFDNVYPDEYYNRVSEQIFSKIYV